GGLRPTWERGGQCRTESFRGGCHSARFSGHPLASTDRRGRVAVDLVLERALEHVDDLLSGMAVPNGRHFGADVDAVLDPLPPGNAEVVPVEVGTPEPRRLLHSRRSSSRY